MDNMLEHPWNELQLLIKEKWLTQKAFASILWKKVSEVNELLKWKRNITIQRDYLLHQTLWTPIKYWILKQIDYDYSLIDIDEKPLISPIDKEKLDDILSSNQIEKHTNDEWIPEWETDLQEIQVETQETSDQEPDSKDNEDYQNRVKIFKSF